MESDKQHAPYLLPRGYRLRFVGFVRSPAPFIAAGYGLKNQHYTTTEWSSIPDKVEIKVKVVDVESGDTLTKEEAELQP